MMIFTRCPECNVEIELHAPIPEQGCRYYCRACEKPVLLHRGRAEHPDDDVPRPRVLVVEDTVTVRAAIRDTLEIAGFEVQTAGDGDETLDKIEDFDPDVVVLDLVLPGRDGFDVLEALSRRGGSRPQVLVMSGRIQEADAIHRAHALGAAGFIPKSALRDTLVFRVRNTLGSLTHAGA